MKSIILLLLLLHIIGPIYGGILNTYDSQNRLTQITYSDGTVETFTYDLVGNRLTHRVVPPPVQCQVAVSSGGNGNVYPSGTQTVQQGSYLYVAASPDLGHFFTGWTVSSSVVVVDDSSAGVFAVNGPGTIQANFSPSAYFITMNVSGAGSTSPSGAFGVSSGADVFIQCKWNLGYRFLNWTSTGGLTIENSTSPVTNIKNITSSGTVTANFIPTSYTVTVGKTGSGTVTPAGNNTVSYGADLSISATPDAGYNFVNWTTTGGMTVENSALASTKIKNVASSGTVTANFATTTFTVTVKPVGNGTVSPAGDNTVNSGSDLSITATPNPGYYFGYWSATGGLTVDLVGGAATKIKNVSTSGVVTAYFYCSPCTLTIASSGNGHTTPSGVVQLYCSDSIDIQAIAGAGSHFVRWHKSGILDIEDSIAPNSRIKNIGSNGILTAVFSIDTLPGSITIDGIDAATGVYLYATNSWIGKKVLDGPGTIPSLKPGIYRLCLINNKKRCFYQTVTVAENAATLVHASMSDPAPLIFLDKSAVRDNSNSPIVINPAGAAVMDDIDGDGVGELMCVSQIGTITIYKNPAAWIVYKTFSLSLSSGENATCIRIADFASTNSPELIVGCSTGRILTADFNGTITGTLFTAPPGLTGFDFMDMNHDGNPDILLGFSDGTMKIAQSAGNLSWGSTSAVNASVSSNAAPISLDWDANGRFDIISGNGNSAVAWFSDTGSFSFLAKGSVNCAGMPLNLNSNVNLSVAYSDGAALPSAVVVDGSGNVNKVQATISGDITGSGNVDILCLQHMGMHWGMTENDTGWSGSDNLDLTPGSNGLQVIDILDLLALAKSWGLK